MMSACKSSSMAGLTVLLTSRAAVAETSSSASTVGTGFILESLTLFLVFACVLMTFKLYRTIRGGRLSRGWKWFLFGFTVLLASRNFCSFGGRIGVVPTWNGGIWVDVLRVFSQWSCCWSELPVSASCWPKRRARMLARARLLLHTWHFTGPGRW